MRGLSLVVASGGHSSSRCAGLSLSWPLLLQSTGSRRAGSVVVAHGPSCSVACGIFPDQGLNPCPLHWQADSQPLRHQGSPPQLLSAINRGEGKNSCCFITGETEVQRGATVHSSELWERPQTWCSAWWPTCIQGCTPCQAFCEGLLNTSSYLIQTAVL